jgi:hypothetical protein
MRAVIAVLAVGFLLAGGIGSFLTWANTDPEQWAPNGWWLIAAIGVVLAFADWAAEERSVNERAPIAPVDPEYLEDWS